MRMAPLAATITAGLALSATGSPASAAGPAEVVVLATLHQLHATTPWYGFDDLARIIEDLEPSVLLVELTAEDLEERKDQKTKQEYPRSVFPLLEKHRYEAVPLEPPEPEFSRLVGLMRQAHADTGERAPAADERFGAYAEALLAVLLAHWDSPAAVNSPLTDRLFEAKHALQGVLYGEGEVAAWEGWNAHFLQTILDTARRHPGERLLVLVGAEHGYWLRRELRGQESVRLLDAEELLR